MDACAASDRLLAGRLPPSTSEIQRTPELRLSATAGQEPEVEVALV